MQIRIILYQRIRTLIEHVFLFKFLLTSQILKLEFENNLSVNETTVHCLTFASKR